MEHVIAAGRLRGEVMFRWSVSRKNTVARMNVALVTGAALLCMVTAAQSGTLEEELKFLLETHPQLDVGAQGVKTAEDGVDAAFSGFLPKVSINGDAGWEYTTNDTLTEAYDTDRFRAGIEARQNLFQGFRTTAEIATAESQKEIAELDLSFVEQQLLFEGVIAFLNVERFGFLTLLAQENEKTLKTQLRLEDERVQRGAGIEVDVLQAKSRLQRAIERRVGIEGSRREAGSRYLQVFGKQADESGLFEAVPPLDKLPASLKDSLARAVDTNLQIRSSNIQTRVAEAQKKQAASGYYPSVDAVARYDWEKDVDGTEGTEDSFFGGVELNWEVFSGFLTDAQVGQASARHNSSLASLRYTRQKVEEEVRVAWQSLETAQERERLLENAVNIAAEVFVARQKLRDGGKETALNVLDAENEFYAARIAQVGASYEARSAVYKLLLAIGELNPTTLGLM